MKVNIKKLHTELYYHPRWPKDKPTFIKLLHQPSFTNSDFIVLAKLYIQYSHLHCFQASELGNYFQYIFTKTQIHNAQELFQKTRKLYQTYKRNL